MVAAMKLLVRGLRSALSFAAASSLLAARALA
jgi:hypothetical protein